MPKGGTFTLGKNATIFIGGNGTRFPASYNIYALDPSSVTIYLGTSQIISTDPIYGDLELQYSGVKTLGGNISIKGNLHIEDESFINYPNR